MSLATRSVLTGHNPFTSRVGMALVATAQGYLLGTLTIPSGISVTLAQCGKFNDALVTAFPQYLVACVAAVVNFPAIATIIDATDGTPDAMNAAIQDADILSAVADNYLQFAASF